MNWKVFLRLLAHAGVSSAAVTATQVIQSGAPITSGNVLIPALVAGALAAVHAALPSPLPDSQNGQSK